MSLREDAWATDYKQLLRDNVLTEKNTLQALFDLGGLEKLILLHQR